MLRVLLPFIATALVVLAVVLGAQALTRGVRQRERAYLDELQTARAALDQVRTTLLESPMPFEPQVVESIGLIDEVLGREIDP